MIVLILDYIYTYDFVNGSGFELAPPDLATATAMRVLVFLSRRINSVIPRKSKLKFKHNFNDFNRGKNTTLIESSSLLQKGMHDISLRYEIVSKLVKRANKIFVILMGINHGIALFLEFVLFYVLQNKKIP